MHKARVWRPVLSSDMSRAVLWVFKARALTRQSFVYETTSLFEWKRRLDKSHVPLNQWPVLRRHNCLFTASSKSSLAFPSPIHPFKCHADSGCLAAAVLELFLLGFFFFFWLIGNKVSSFFTALLIGSTISAGCRVALMLEDGIVKDVLYLRGTGRTQNVTSFAVLCYLWEGCPLRLSHAALSMCVFTHVPTCSHLHVSSQGADPPLTSSTGQEDGDDGQQGADGQQSTASWAEHRTGLKHRTTSR